MSGELNIPLTFVPVYKDNLWGGRRIPEKYRRSGTPEVCAESWEISAHPAGMGVVDGGPFAGRSLADLAVEYGASLTGKKAPAPDRFPLLFKIIDNREIQKKHFGRQADGAVLLSDDGRKLFLHAWQERKRDAITHPYLQEKIYWGLVPYVQALLLARYLRGDLDGYPTFFWK